MKKIVLVAACFILFAAAANADSFGSAFGNLATARTLDQGRADFGGGVGIADGTSVFGRFTYGTSQFSELRLKLGIIDGDASDAELALGADFQYHFLEVTRDEQGNMTTPFDLAAGGLFEWVDFSGISIWQLGGFVTGSHPFALKSGGVLSPYARINVRLESVSDDTEFGSGDSSDLEFGLHLGTEWMVNDMINLYGEFQLDGNDGLFLGIDFNVM